jgi:hypothetical protein
MNFMEAMPKVIYGGRKDWEFRKELITIGAYRKNKDGRQERYEKKGFEFFGYDRESRGALRRILAGYKVLWNAAKKDPKQFNELIEDFRNGKIRVHKAEKSNYETLGLIGSFDRNYDDCGSCLDRYDLGSWTRGE